uniref:Sperm associated antigen 7 n=1 Tax=Hucho hucho TaxID=62062 RepID=A0A4W5R8K4_9TELE
MEKLPTVGDKESRRRDREQAARMKKMQEDEKKKSSGQGDDRVCMISRHDVEFAPSDDELEAYRKGMQWDPQKEQAALEEETANKTQKRAGSPSSNYRDKYSHLISTSAARMHTSGQQKDTCSIEQAMNVIRAKKRQKTGAEDAGEGSSTTS